MPKKLTYEFVKESFEKKGYMLLSEEYINSIQKLKCVCPQGHGYSVSWSNWRKGRQCPFCSGCIRYSIEDIRMSLKKENYILIADKYINSNTKLEYLCSKGHRHSTTWDNWQLGHRCPVCSGVAKHNIEFIKKSFESENYILLSKKYKNNKTKLNYICPKGHVHNISWGSWQRGHRCQICTFASNRGASSHYFKGAVTKLNLPLYDTFALQLDLAEEVRPFYDEENRKLLEVRCSKCGEWFVPSRSEVRHRINSLNGKGTGECKFYCSQSCKDNCEVYRKNPNFYLDLTPKELPYTPEELQIWSQEVLSRADYECEICGLKAEHAHHIQPKKLEPGFALDPENGLALCKECHYKYGHADSCSTGQLAVKVCK